MGLEQAICEDSSVDAFHWLCIEFQCTQFNNSSAPCSLLTRVHPVYQLVGAPSSPTQVYPVYQLKCTQFTNSTVPNLQTNALPVRQL